MTRRMTRLPPAEGTGERLRHARIAAGYLEQTDLAAALGMRNSNSVYRWETAGDPIGRRYLKQLCGLLKVTESWLLYGTERADAPRKEPAHLHVVESYLASDMGRDTPPAAETLLRGFDFRQVGVMRPTVRHAHLVREVIEMSLAIGKLPKDG